MKHSDLIFLYFVVIIASVLFPEVGSANNVRVKKSPENKETGLFADFEKVSAENKDDGDKDKSKIGYLTLPPDYNKLIIPLGNISKEIFVNMHFAIREVLDVDNIDGIVEIDTEIGVTWIDWEIWKFFLKNKEAREKAKYGGFGDSVILDAEFLKKIWLPDIFIEEMASVERTSLLAKLIKLSFVINEKTPNFGQIEFRARQTIKIRCDMDFHYYPADIQVCPLSIRSYSYPQEQLFITWSSKFLREGQTKPKEYDPSVYLDITEGPNFDFQISGVEPGGEVYESYTRSQSLCCGPQNFSTISFKLEIRRNLTYHLVQTCLPSVLLILITWLCFLLPADMVEARIGISMTTLLTLTAMFAAVRDKSPDVSYATALDIWMVFCIVLLFIALVLFTGFYWMRRKLERFEKTNPDEIESLGGAELVKHQRERYKMLVRLVRQYSFLIFAWFFISFLVVFPTWLFVQSNYYGWDPSPKFNALPLGDEGDDSNRLFTRLNTPFKETNVKKNVENSFRYRDIFYKVISPIKAQYDGEEEDDEYDEEEIEDDSTTEISTANITIKSTLLI